MLKRTGCAIAAFLTVALAANAFAQGTAPTGDYPKKPITALMGFAPGGGSDVMLSMVRPQLEKLLKTTLVPVYKPGAGSDIAATELAMSKPDGYTVFVSCTPMIPINAYVRETSYKVADLAFVANVVTDPGVFVVRAESPYKTIADVIKAAKSKPGALSVGVASAPGDDWFAMHQFEGAAQIKFNIVPFPGDGPSWQAALAGHVDATANNLGIVYPQMRAGKLRALAIMSDKRSPIVPDIPTFKELGYNFTSGSSRGFAMPKNTPKPIVDMFANAVKQLMSTEEFKANALKTAFPYDYQGPEEYSAYMKSLDTVYRPLWDKFGKSADGGSPKK
ncbi:MAG: tripartite tricarboxylate transporter substrate binding protein [Betaproteobacteria bacterium]|jgi:tripartite-type tricarboxylate transporter receptor subunit TctC|nr:tripartite tricarboxylate transporter substrate binding protein [Betaproteobacteria bacterium]